MFCLQSHSISYKAICRWLLLLLGLEVSGEAGPAVNQGRLLLVLGLGPLSQRCELSESQMMLIQENLGRSEAWAKTSHSCGKAIGNSLGGLKFGWDRSSRTHQGGATVLGRSMESQIWHPPAGCVCGGRAQKRNNGLCQHFYLGEVAPQLSPWYQTIQFLPVCV